MSAIVTSCCGRTVMMTNRKETLTLIPTCYYGTYPEVKFCDPNWVPVFADGSPLRCECGEELRFERLGKTVRPTCQNGCHVRKGFLAHPLSASKQ